MTIVSLNDEVGRVLGGRYRLLAPVGSGASARVFLAEDVTLRRRVAVKILHEALAHDDAFLRRFRAEAQSAASLNHPHVLGVFDWGHDDVPFLVTEFLAGGSLRSMLDAGHRLTQSQALLVGLEAARGLEYAHDQGLVHRDIKPDNLLFDDTGRLRIADFGLARALAEAGLTEPGDTVLGTARYASPELARGEPVGPAADIYALALTLDEAVTGKPTFSGDTTLELLMARAETPVEPSPELGPLQGVVRQAGVVDPAGRPDAAALGPLLLAAATDLARPEPLPLVGAAVEVAEGADPTHLGGGSVPIDHRPFDDAERRRWPWMLLTALVVIASVVGGAYAWVQSQPDTDPVPDLVGMQDRQAVAAVADFDWALDLVQVREPDTERGEVVRTEPAAGTELGPGDELILFVSLGEPLVSVPDVVGLPVEQATAILTDEGLGVGSVQEADSEELAAGLVIALDLPLGTVELEPGTLVDLVVSTGPAPRTIPEVPADGSVETAVAELEALRLVPIVVEDYHDEVPVGQVIGFDDTSGALVPAGSEVIVLVSLGPEPRVVPNVIGLTVEQATEELVEAGFVVSRVEGDPRLPVLATDPPADETHDFGTAVVIATQL